MSTEISTWSIRSFKDDLASARLGINLSGVKLESLPQELQESVKRIHQEFDQEVDAAREWCKDAAVFLGLNGVDAEIVSYAKVMHYYIRNSRTSRERRDPSVSFVKPLPVLGPEFFGGRTLPTPPKTQVATAPPRPQSIFATLSRHPGMDTVEGASCMMVDPDLYYHRRTAANLYSDESEGTRPDESSSVFLRKCPEGHSLSPVTRDSYGDLRRVYGRSGGPVVMGIRQTCVDEDCAWEYRTHNIK
ncbi:hypothetical protein HDU93_001126 [Gonapodya sp. JEL0774]|nr:hypothetical protein HDU93_001126 [Gonapodya sp. JEL0774]